MNTHAQSLKRTRKLAVATFACILAFAAFFAVSSTLCHGQAHAEQAIDSAVKTGAGQLDDTSNSTAPGRKLAGSPLAAGSGTQSGSKPQLTADETAQKVRPALQSGYYKIYSKATKTRRVVGLTKETNKQNTAACVSAPTQSLYQRVAIRHLGNSVYTIQIANSGKYLADKKGRVVQQQGKIVASTSKPVKRQQWTARYSARGITFTNVATNKVMTVSAKEKNGESALRTTSASGEKAQRFHPARLRSLIPNGTYTLASNAGKVRLNVMNGSWKAGANVWVWSADKSFAQRFTIKQVNGIWYRIQMAISGTALESAKAGKGTTANVRMARLRQNSKKQLWRPTVTDYGLAFVNKSTGCILNIAGKANNGTNVRTSKKTNLKTQGWSLRPTTVNRKSLGTLRELVNHVSGSRNIKFDAKGTGYSLSDYHYTRLVNALSEAWNRDEDVSFIAVDLGTGATLSVGTDRGNHGASTFKGAYVTYIFQELLEKGHVSYDSVEYLINETIGWSNNDTYAQLRARFGSDGFRSWLDTVGLGYLADEYYPWMSARELALLWSKIYAYQNSGGSFTGIWRNTFDHSYYSCVQEQLGGSKRVYSKPGWVPNSALNDGAIVKSKKGTYLIALLSNVYCYGEQWIDRDIVQVVDDIFSDLHRSGSTTDMFEELAPIAL